MSEENSSCCRCCCSFIFTSGLTALFIWLNLRAHNPVCSIENFDVFSLNKSANSSIINNNRTIHYDLKLNNKNNKDKVFQLFIKAMKRKLIGFQVLTVKG
ncbi:unnamed protein product [Amaranthus hypochondriacus]